MRIPRRGRGRCRTAGIPALIEIDRERLVQLRFASTRTRARDLGMEFLDPRGVSSRSIEAYDLRAELKEGDTVALFANGFPDSVAFLGHVGQALSQELPGVEFIHLDKGNASALASEDHLSTIADTCSAVVAAYGH